MKVPLRAIIEGIALDPSRYESRYGRALILYGWFA